MDGRKEVRSHYRFRVLLSNGEQSVVAAYASTENVSRHGARVQTDRPWAPGTYVLVKSSLGELWAHARIVYCQTLPSKMYALGLQLLVRTGAWVMMQL